MWRSIGIKWGLAVLYLAMCLSLLLVFPVWSRWLFLLAYAAYSAWLYWTEETGYGKHSSIRPLTRWDVPDYPRFREQLTQACAQAGLRREPVWAVLRDDTPNAWALGGRRGIVVFTTALLRQHPPDEVLAIAGHELKHLASKDSLPALLGAAWLSMVGYLSAVIRRLGEATRGNIVGPVCLLISLVLDLLLMVVGWVAHVVLAKRSRFDEHQADLTGARLTSAATMIAALQRLETSSTARQRPSDAKWSPAWIARELHASHPPTPARVAYLQTAAERGDVRA